MTSPLPCDLGLISRSAGIGDPGNAGQNICRVGAISTLKALSPSHIEEPPFAPPAYTVAAENQPKYSAHKFVNFGHCSMQIWSLRPKTGQNHGERGRQL